jgi:hypothetical protein
MKDERLTREIYESREQGKNKIERPRLKCEDQMRQEARKTENPVKGGKTIATG